MKFYIVFIREILRTINGYKLWNVIKLYCSFALSCLFKRHTISALPAFISIEPTNICNLRCPECPTGNKSSIVPKGKIRPEVCGKLIPQIERHTFFANLYFQGEPFINENMCDIIAMTHNAGILTSLSTNAHFISDEIADGIVSAQLTKIIISLDGYDQGSYEKYRRNGSFDKVISGLKAIQESKRKFKSDLPLVELQCLLFSHTEHHLNDIIRIGKTYSVDRVVFKTAQFYDTENQALMPSQKNSRYLVGKDSLVIKKKLKNRCWKMWSSCVIAWNGNVLPCCFDKNHTFTFGNICDTDLQTIWFSKQYQRFRDIVQSQRKEIDMCRNCSE